MELSILNFILFNSLIADCIWHWSCADEKSDQIKDASISVVHAAARRDVATQISPGSSTLSSPEIGNSFSASTPSTLPTAELQSLWSSKVEVGDTLLDEWVALRKSSRKSKLTISRNSSKAASQKKKGESSAWDAPGPEVAQSVSKYASFSSTFFHNNRNFQSCV